jgi:hypothetical protein
MRVRATQRGYYGSRVREPGEEFGLAKDEDFSPKWMVETEASKRARSEVDAEASAEDDSPKADAKAEDGSPETDADTKGAKPAKSHAKRGKTK